jgi:KDO2-lipid IV(A) lauroyltransferase
MGRMRVEEVQERAKVAGLEAFEAAVAEGAGAIVVTGHFGNWEFGGAFLAARGIPMDVVAQRQRNPLFDRDLSRHRLRLGMTVVERREAPKRILRSLRAGRVVGIVGDQNVRRGGAFVEFFGRKASTAKGAGVFALRARVPVFLGIVRRAPGFPQRYDCSLERVDFTPTGDMEEDVLRLTQAHTKLLEDQVRQAPEQYFWQHRRWKTRPAEEAPKAAIPRPGFDRSGSA